MIFFYGEGRLGNQIFQYQALCSIAKPQERMVAIGLEDLQGVFVLRGTALSILTHSKLVKRLVKYLLSPLVLRPLARNLRVFNYVREGSVGETPYFGRSGELVRQRGLLGRFTFVDGGHYQNAAYWRSLFPTPLLEVRGDLVQAARRYLRSVCGEAKAVFAHVRRSDYLSHRDYGLDDLCLPAGYYRKAFGELKHRLPGRAHLIFVTDDPQWVVETFADVDAKTVTSHDAALDFAIMTQCVAGIISNSTFSLAAALMLKDPAVVIAPEHWIGFRVKSWYPPAIRFQHPSLLYISAIADPKISAT